MQNIDIIGLDNILKYIEASKLSKFTICRANANGNFVPVFECLNSNNNETAINEFRRWAEVINNNVAYKIMLFDFAEYNTDENGNIKPIKAKGKSGKIESIFVINSAPQFSTQPQTNDKNIGAYDIANLRAEIINEISKKQEENAILKEIAELKQKFAELDEEEEEEEEETNNKGIAGINGEQLTQIMGLINMFKSQSTPNAINGIEETNTTDFKTNINTAIKILYKHNKQLDTDLLKLSQIAENKPDMFKMLLTTLRTM